MKFILTVEVLYAFTILTTRCDPDFNQELSQGVLFTKGAQITLTDEKWTLAISIDLNNYLDLMFLVRQQMKFLDLVSQSITTSMSNYHMTFLNDERQLMTKCIDHIAEIIKGIRDTTAAHRSKRGLINIGGTARKFLFGSPDANDIATIETQFKGMEAVNVEVIHSLKA
ncbi:unnamed protein product [Ceutorhynchus assimilis]|uniref:Uncharacterized protein n=1 Tax=Ceutorhynchus assimilis TaxID=467358 RepID=A0A9N9MVP9_9CUCU|nr:unnamed protein product [Ceutorhynchus assimilis]